MTEDASVRDPHRDLNHEAQIARLTEALAARDEFLAVAAHELRNPMTPMVGRLSILRRKVEKGGLSAEAIVQSLDELEWLMTVFLKRANTLLDVSRMTTGKLRLECVPVDLGETVRTVVKTFRPLAGFAGSTLDMDMPGAGPIVIGDPLAVEQVLDNLVSNAIKYGGGKPILVSADGDPRIGVARLSVADNGPGISTESQARIFEQFERAVEPGAFVGGFGIGLWVVKQLTDAMGGAIEVASTPGVGATFCVTLPMQSMKDME